MIMMDTWIMTLGNHGSVMMDNDLRPGHFPWMMVVMMDNDGHSWPIVMDQCL